MHNAAPGDVAIVLISRISRLVGAAADLDQLVAKKHHSTRDDLGKNAQPSRLYTIALAQCQWFFWVVINVVVWSMGAVETLWSRVARCPFLVTDQFADDRGHS